MLDFLALVVKFGLEGDPTTAFCKMRWLVWGGDANAEMLSLYFGIGRYVSYKTQTEKWGTGVIDTISAQLQKEMPGSRGFSGKNIRSMRQFYKNWAKELIWPPAATKLEMGITDDKMTLLRRARSRDST